MCTMENILLLCGKCVIFFIDEHNFWFLVEEGKDKLNEVSSVYTNYIFH